MRYEQMSPEQRASAAQAASRYLLDHDYASLDEACRAETLAVQDLWDKIMDAAGLPASDVPQFMMVL